VFLAVQSIAVVFLFLVRDSRAPTAEDSNPHQSLRDAYMEPFVYLRNAFIERFGRKSTRIENGQVYRRAASGAGDGIEPVGANRALGPQVQISPNCLR
jgi:hypothetical protein